MSCGMSCRFSGIAAALPLEYGLLSICGKVSTDGCPCGWRCVHCYPPNLPKIAKLQRELWLLCLQGCLTLALQRHNLPQVSFASELSKGPPLTTWMSDFSAQGVTSCSDSSWQCLQMGKWNVSVTDLVWMLSFTCPALSSSWGFFLGVTAALCSSLSMGVTVGPGAWPAAKCKGPDHPEPWGCTNHALLLLKACKPSRKEFLGPCFFLGNSGGTLNSW